MPDPDTKNWSTSINESISLGTKSVILSANTSLSLSAFTEGLSVKGSFASADMNFFGAQKPTAQISVMPLTKADKEGEAISNMGVFIADKDLAVLRSIIKRVDVRSVEDHLQVNQVPHVDTSTIKLGAALIHQTPSVSSGAVGVMMILIFGSLLAIGFMTNSILINPAVGCVIIIFGVSFVAMEISSGIYADS